VSPPDTSGVRCSSNDKARLDKLNKEWDDALEDVKDVIREECLAKFHEEEVKLKESDSRDDLFDELTKKFTIIKSRRLQETNDRFREKEREIIGEIRKKRRELNKRKQTPFFPMNDDDDGGGDEEEDEDESSVEMYVPPEASEASESEEVVEVMKKKVKRTLPTHLGVAKDSKELLQKRAEQTAGGALAKRGKRRTEKAFNTMVKDEVFKNHKFVSSCCQQTHDSEFATAVFTALSEEVNIPLWERKKTGYRSRAIYQMNERRSSDTGRMKTAFIGKRIANSVGNKESMIALTVYQPFIHTTLPPVKWKEFLK
jgi:hypothetical protein